MQKDFKKQEHSLNSTTYTFKNIPGSLRKALLCPECGEMLFHEDIEQYFSCPYCAKTFMMTTDLEDFLLNSVIAHWQQISQFPYNDIYLKIQNFKR